ncbi:RNA polymerase sigma factor [Candidatus Clostridium stratigraminis]|uniref:RNA polymerase sigma factor n=1 Tax=Candidatus Clostridium stratigraminis TaxID=3381661 RepID=A0ABW8T0S8_9CLOT
MDTQLLLELYKKQSKIIMGYLIKNGCSREEAEDIVQNSFIKAIKYMDGVSREKLPSWLFKVSLNEFRNLMKKQKRLYQISIDEEGFANQLTVEEDFTEDLLITERNNEVKDRLNKLKDGYKDLLILKYAMELSYKEIALLLGLKESVVKTYLYRARKEFERMWLNNG